jgi:hypothetical protein
MTKKNPAIPPVPKYAEEQNLAWLRCPTKDGSIVAVVEDMVDWMVVFDPKNPADHYPQSREDWNFPSPEGGTAWGGIMIYTLDELMKQDKLGKKVGVSWDPEKKILMFAMDSAWIQSISEVQRDFYNPSIH